MSKVKGSRVAKTYLSIPKKTQDRNDLLASILAHCVDMPSCSACESRGILSCQASPKDSSRCAECFKLGLSSCDVLGPSPADLRKITLQHRRLEEELEAAEERRRLIDAEIERLRKQKKMWSARMCGAIRRGLDSVEELDRVEAEEASRAATAVASEEPCPD